MRGEQNWGSRVGTRLEAGVRAGSTATLGPRFHLAPETFRVDRSQFTQFINYTPASLHDLILRSRTKLAGLRVRWSSVLRRDDLRVHRPVNCPASLLAGIRVRGGCSVPHGVSKVPATVQVGGHYTRSCDDSRGLGCGSSELRLISG